MRTAFRIAWLLSVLAALGYTLCVCIDVALQGHCQEALPMDVEVPASVTGTAPAGGVEYGENGG